MNEKYVRMKDIIEITKLSRATIYREIEKGRIPKPFHPTQRTSLWKVRLLSPTRQMLTPMLITLPILK